MESSRNYEKVDQLNAVMSPMPTSATEVGAREGEDSHMPHDEGRRVQSDGSPFGQQQGNVAEQEEDRSRAVLFGFHLSSLQTKVLAHLLLGASQLLYAVYAVWSQWTLRVYTVEFLLFSRMLSATIQIWMASIFIDKRSRRVHDQPFRDVWGVSSTGGSPAASPWAEIGKVWVLGALAFVLNVYMYLSAIKYTNAVVTTVAQCGTPVVTGVLSILIGVEPFSWLQVVGFVLAIGGNIVQLSVWNAAAAGSNYVFGIVCIVLNVTSFSFFLVFSKPFMRRLPMLIVYRQMIVVGTIGTLILCLIMSPESFQRLITSGSADGWAVGGYIFAVCVMAYVPYAIVGFAMQHNVPPPLMAAHIIYQPVFTAVVAGIALGTVLRWYQYLGGVVALSAVALSVWDGMRHRG